MADNKTEAAELKRIGATPVKNSGRGLRKGDGKLFPFLVDVKEYTKSFSVSRGVWAKLSVDAISNGKMLPALLLCLREKDDPPLRLWVVGEKAFLEMREAWLDKYGEE